MMYICGMGINPLRDFTYGSIKALSNCKRIYFLPEQPIGLSKIFPELDKKEVINLDALYLNGANDSDVYEKIVDRIINDHECEPHDDVAVVFPGHPRVGVTAVSMIVNNMKELDLPYKVLPAISSLDTMTVDLDIDPISNGALVVDANRLVIYEPFISDSYDIFVYHISSVGTVKLNYKKPKSDRKLDLLFSYLKKFLDEKKLCYVICSSISNNMKTDIYETTIGSVHELDDSIHYGTTLYIPRNPDANFNMDKVEEILKNER